LFEEFLVPTGTSYTCGDSDQNIYHYKSDDNTSSVQVNATLTFRGLQVG
jgi:hypothetical protein